MTKPIGYFFIDAAAEVWKIEPCCVISERGSHTETSALIDPAQAGIDAARRVEHSFQQEIVVVGLLQACFFSLSARRG